MNKEIIQVFKIIGQNIKENREKKGITLEEVSQKTGIRIAYLKKIENGEAFRVSTKHLFLIAEALNIMPHILVKGL